jgi:hypothetical protein
MPHVVIAACSAAEVPAQTLAQALKAQARDAEQPRLNRVTRLALDPSPALNRLRVVIGLGWQARSILDRVAKREGAPVDFVVELCGCGRHHLLGLGRAGMPTVRWIPASSPGRPDRLDALAAREGSALVGGSVAYTESVAGLIVPCVPLPEDAREARDEALAQRGARAIVTMLEAQRVPPGTA